ncbi:zinc knuckle-domain-containing protein [Ophiocordyceps camponoti-floridani]|uniref:Zinc knuckle-domain-containing protein n=1 Tax=Ophiocordyceps camponoti-floridani TaxID=2030778 RepID=A0A8H4VF31_9HYPO|nr:zinc knuckle-domain-containing protein [Ophiocordyceps camponoti-floridani]
MSAYRPRRGPLQSTPTNVQCQKCLKRGHYSYECKASAQDRPYVSRPSRSQQLRNPKLIPELTGLEPPATKKGTADAKAPVLGNRGFLMPKFDHRSLHAAGAALYLRTVASEGLAVMPTAAARGVIHLGARMHHTDDTARTERTTRGLAVLPQAAVHHPVELDFLSHRAARKAQNFQLANQVALDAAVTIATESTEPDLQIQCATTAAHQLPMTICDGLRVPRINAAPRVVEAGPQFHRADIVAQRRSVTGDETPESPTSGARRITAPGLRFHHAGGVARNLIVSGFDERYRSRSPKMKGGYQRELRGSRQDCHETARDVGMSKRAVPDESERPRSLSPFSKRLAMTKAMHGDGR